MVENVKEEQRRRGLWLAVPLALVATLLVGGYLLVAPREDVTMPNKDATPEQVVEAYIDAINVRDYETSNAIFPHAAHSPRGFFSGYERIELKSIDRVIGDKKDHAHVVFTAEFKGGDGSLSGLEPWGYSLARTSDGHWFITGQGMG